MCGCCAVFSRRAPARPHATLVCPRLHPARHSLAVSLARFDVLLRARATVGHPPNANERTAQHDRHAASESLTRPTGAARRTFASACGGATVVGGASCLWRRPLALLEALRRRRSFWSLRRLRRLWRRRRRRRTGGHWIAAARRRCDRRRRRLDRARRRALQTLRRLSATKKAESQHKKTHAHTKRNDSRQQHNDTTARSLAARKTKSATDRSLAATKSQPFVDLRFVRWSGVRCVSLFNNRCRPWCRSAHSPRTCASARRTRREVARDRPQCDGDSACRCRPQLVAVDGHTIEFNRSLLVLQRMAIFS